MTAKCLLLTGNASIRIRNCTPPLSASIHSHFQLSEKTELYSIYTIMQFSHTSGFYFVSA